MVQFAQFIRNIEMLQNADQPHPLFFLAENVWLKGSDLEEVRDAFAFDWDPILLDAQYLSPSRRKRHFFMNIPLLDMDYDGPLSQLGPTSCLEDDFCVPAHLVDPDTTAKVGQKDKELCRTGVTSMIHFV